MKVKELLHTPEGVRDIYGAEYAKKLLVEEEIHENMKRFGYQDIQTPSFEFFDVFSKEIGTTPSRELYKFMDKDGNTLVLRPDFTPSMARCAAKYFMEEEFPIRFCYCGNSFTHGSRLQGKLNEMTQMGAELMGDGSLEADAELIAMLISSLKKTGLSAFQVSIGEVEYFKGICEQAGVDADTEALLRENISGKNIFAVEDLLREREVDSEYHQVFAKLPELFGSFDILETAVSLAENPKSVLAVEKLGRLYELLKLYGVEEYVSFDFGMLNKYEYYTGVIFEAYTYEVGDAIAKGGRYDSLLKKFGKDSPAIGFVILIDDLLTALVRQKVELPIQRDNTLIIYERANFPSALEKATKLREEGSHVELIQKSDEIQADRYMTYARKNGYGRLFFEQ